MHARDVDQQLQLWATAKGFVWILNNRRLKKKSLSSVFFTVDAGRMLIRRSNEPSVCNQLGETATKSLESKTGDH